MSAIGRKRSCAYCRRPAVFLCDFPTMHSSPDFYPPRPTTCQMPVCGEHCVVVEETDVCTNHAKLIEGQAAA